MTTSHAARQTAPKRPDAHAVSLGARETIARTIKQSRDDDVSGLAAELAYRSALAVLPFLLIIAALPSVVGSVFSIPDLGNQIVHQAEADLSKNSATMIRTIVDEIERSKGWAPLITGLVGATWAGTMANSSLRKALNRIYKFDDRASMIVRLVTDVGLSLVTGVLFFVAVVIVLLGRAVLGDGIGKVVSPVLALAAVFTAVTLLYWLAPADKHEFRWVTPGALFFCIAWLAFSLGFSIYLSRFGQLNRVYGSLGAMVALLIWLYGSNAALLLGAELNSVVASKHDPEVHRETS